MLVLRGGEDDDGHDRKATAKGGETSEESIIYGNETGVSIGLENEPEELGRRKTGFLLVSSVVRCF